MVLQSFLESSLLVTFWFKTTDRSPQVSREQALTSFLLCARLLKIRRFKGWWIRVTDWVSGSKSRASSFCSGGQPGVAGLMAADNIPVLYPPEPKSKTLWITKPITKAFTFVYMSFEACKRLSQTLFHVSLINKCERDYSSQIANKETKTLRDEVICPRSPGVPVSLCFRLLSAHFALFCPESLGLCAADSLPVASRQVWLLGVYDRRLEESRSLCFSFLSASLSGQVTSSASGLTCSVCLRLLPNKCLGFWDLVTPPSSMSLQAQEQQHLPVVANLWFLIIPCLALQLFHHLCFQLLMLNSAERSRVVSFSWLDPAIIPWLGHPCHEEL